MTRQKLGKNHALSVILTPAEREFIRREAQRRGWNQTDLARHAGLSQMTISNALRGYGLFARNRIAIYQALENNPVELQTA